MFARDRKGVGVMIVSSVRYESIDNLDLSDISVPAVNGLGSEGSLRCFWNACMSNGDNRLSFSCKASCIDWLTGRGRPLFERDMVCGRSVCEWYLR